MVITIYIYSIVITVYIVRCREDVSIEVIKSSKAIIGSILKMTGYRHDHK